MHAHVRMYIEVAILLARMLSGDIFMGAIIKISPAVALSPVSLHGGRSHKANYKKSSVVQCTCKFSVCRRSLSQ